jgi:antitoxin VapB
VDLTIFTRRYLLSIVARAKLFKNGQSQAVRLPKEFRFDGKSVSIQKVGDSVVFSPISTTWDSFFEAAAEFSDDFMEERDAGFQPPREGL